MRNKKRVITAFFFVLLVVGGGLYARNKYATSLGWKWFYEYNKADDMEARKVAKSLWWMGRGGLSSYFLAHMAVSDSMDLTGHNRKDALTKALSELEQARTLAERNSDDYWLMASLNAMLGNVPKAKEYVSKACVFEKIVHNDRDCLLIMYSPNYGSDAFPRYGAVRLYELVKLAEAIGGLDENEPSSDAKKLVSFEKLDKNELDYGEMMALVSFDKGKSNILRDDLMRDGQMTPQRTEGYCRILHYRENDLGKREKDATDEKLCAESPLPTSSTAAPSASAM